VSEGPAALAGLRESKGRIAPGFDADLVVVDPERTTVVRPQMMRSRQRHSALEGLVSSFAIVEVYVRGRAVARQGRMVGVPGGRMVRPMVVPS